MSEKDLDKLKLETLRVKLLKLGLRIRPAEL
jgi:hypothetical protein